MKHINFYITEKLKIDNTVKNDIEDNNLTMEKARNIISRYMTTVLHYKTHQFKITKEDENNISLWSNGDTYRFRIDEIAKDIKKRLGIRKQPSVFASIIYFNIT